MKPFWKTEIFTLENGLTIEWVHMKGFHSHSCYVTVPLGSLFDAEIDHKKTPTGVAHFLEHRLFDTPKGDALGRFSSLGCDANAFTTYTFTAYYFDTSLSFMEGIDLLLEMTNHLTFHEKEVENEKSIILEERKMVLDQPIHRLQNGLFQNLFSRFVYQEEIVGSAEDIQNTSWHDLKRVFDYAYDPEKMRLFIFGSLTKEQQQTLKKMSIPKKMHRPICTKDENPINDKQKEQEHECEMDIPIPYLAVGKKCFDIEKKLGISKAQLEALRDVASQMLFSDSSPLLKKMHQENLLVTSLYGEITPVGGAYVLAVVTNSFHEEDMMQRLTDYLDHLEDYIDLESWKRVVQNCIGSRILSLQSLSQFGYEYVSCRMQNLDLAEVISSYAALTKEMLIRFLSLWKEEEIATYVVKCIEKKKKRK